ncbi:MAG: hypothetical protein WCI90_08445 [Chlorobium sp.]|nr:MAG: hypothetical protein FDX17_07510 [Chlorobium sp.]
MSDNPEKQKQASDQVDGWFSKNISPILAFVTVILTFFMFGFFIFIIMNPPNDEIRAVSSAEQKYETARIDSTRQATVNKLNVKSSKIDSTRQKGEEGLKDEPIVLRHKVAYAKAALEEKQGRRTAVKEIILYILGVLSSILTSIFSYYFGSSNSSAKKNDTLNTLAKNAST